MVGYHYNVGLRTSSADMVYWILVADGRVRPARARLAIADKTLVPVWYGTRLRTFFVIVSTRPEKSRSSPMSRPSFKKDETVFLGVGKFVQPKRTSEQGATLACWNECLCLHQGETRRRCIYLLQVGRVQRGSGGGLTLDRYRFEGNGSRLCRTSFLLLLLAGLLPYAMHY